MNVVVLPLPPSLNNAYINLARGRAKAPAYKAWLTHAGIMLKVQGSWRVTGPVRVSVDLPQNMRGDLDNRIKPILDLLVTHERIDDDRNVRHLAISKCWAAQDTCHVKVEAQQ